MRPQGWETSVKLDGIEQTLRHFDRFVSRISERSQMFDELRASVRVQIVKLVADSGLLLARLRQ